MAWVRIHDGAVRHPKICRLSDAAFRLWIAGLAYCQEQLTDGQIGRDHLALLSVRVSRKTVDELVDATLWDRRPEGFQVHDYLDWNDSRDTVLRNREDAKARMRRLRGGLRSPARSPERSPERTPERSPARSPEVRPLVRPPTPHHTTGETAEGAVSPRAREAPLIRGGEHRTHASCGRSCVPAQLHEEFCRKLGGDPDETDRRLRAWYRQVQEGWQDKPLPANDFAFWRARYDEWQNSALVATAPAKPTAYEQALDRMMAPMRQLAKEAARKP